MQALPLLGALTLSLAITAPASAFSKDDHYHFGEMAAVCGLYHQDQYSLSVVRHWSHLTDRNASNVAPDVLRLARTMHKTWIRERDPKSEEMRRDFLTCYDTIIRILD